MLFLTSLRRASLTALGLASLALIALVIGCSGGGGGSGGGSVSTGTGSVAVLVTDGPVDPDEFSHIFVTFSSITLIGPDGPVEIFDGEETLDLRELEDASTLVTLGLDVPARPYEKIRLDVTEIELVPADGGPSIFPKLPPKIDLNPRGTFEVEPGELLLVQIDMDAGKSIHLVETGNGGFRFRPVIFVDILNGADDGKLVLLRGVVDEVGDDSLLLCETHPVSRPLGATRTTERRDDDDDDEGDDDGDDGEDGDRCIEVEVDADTSLFDESADPIELADVEPGDPAFVLGRFLRDDDEDLDFLAEVVLLGDDVLAVDGEVTEEVDAQDRFELELDPGQGVVTEDGLLRVQLQDGTKLFERSGEPLDPEDVAVGDAARAVGVLALSSTSDDLLKAAWVMLDVEAADASRLEGEITAISNAGARIQVATDAGNRCVDVPADARVFEVASDDESAEEILRSQLAVGDAVSVFGEPGVSCFAADTVIVFEGADD